MKASVLLLVILLVVVQPPLGAAFFGKNKNVKSMFYNPGYIEVIDARLRMGLHIPSEKDEFNTWYKRKFSPFAN